MLKLPKPKIKGSTEGVTKNRFRKAGMMAAALALILAISIFYYFNSAVGASVDVLNGTGSFDNSTQTGAWTLKNTTGTSTWAIDTTTFYAGTGSGRLQSPTGNGVSYDSYSYYRFTTTKLPVSATLNLAYRKNYYNAQPSTGNWNVTAEIWSTGTSPALMQSFTIDNGNTNVNWTNIATQNITAITNANTQYEIRLHIKGKTGANSSAYVRNWFDSVVLNVTYDSTPPQVSSANPVNDHSVNVVFNESVDSTTAQTLANYSISPSLNITGAVLQSDGKTVQLTTATQTKGTQYTVTVNNVKDISGNAMTTPGTATFTGIDTTPPQVSSAIAVDQNTVNLVYNEAVDPTTAQNTVNYSISPALAVSGAVLQADGKTLQLTTATQTYGTAYTITASNVLDTSGNVITGNNTGVFNGVDKVPPTVSQTNVINDTTIDVVYSKAIDPTTSQNIANYSISPTLTVSSANLQADGVTVRLVTSQQTKGTAYAITINNVKDSHGNTIAANTTTSYTGIDTTPPTVTSAASTSSSSVNVVFNEAVDSTTAQTVANYSINPALSVTGAVLQSDGVTVKLTTASQAGGTNYTVTVTNVKDVSGNVISGSNTATFAGTAPDYTPPTVVSVSAVNNYKVNVIFSKTMDPTTSQNTANYSMSPVLSVTGATLQADGITVVLVTAPQTVGTLYTLTVSNVQDRFGNMISNTGNKGTFTGVSVATNPHANLTENGEKCASCHVSHRANGPELNVQNTITELCYLCHDAAGESKYDVASEFGSPNPQTSHHKVPEGTQQCTDCHNPHGGKDASGNPWPRLLQSSADTTQHSGNQFCLSCHQNNQGPNTPALNPAYYPAAGVGHNNSAYTVNGTTPFNPSSGTQISCIGCHQDHGSSVPRLLNDNPSNDTTPATGNDKTFCVKCHFGNSANNRYLGSTVYDNSKHSLTTSSNTNASYPGISGQAGQCLNCHDPHGSANGTSFATMKTLRTPYTDIPLTTTNKGTINYTTNNFTLCFQCHNNTSANTKYDIQTQYTTTSTKQGGHYIKSAGGNLAVNSVLPCEDCHNLHGSANNNKYSLNDSLGSNLGDGRNECLACHTTGKVVEGLTMSPPPTSVPQHSTTDTTSCLNCHGSAHQPTAGISNGGSDCSACHSNIVNPMSSSNNFHHLLTNSSTTYSITQNGSKNCLSCHVDHNKFNNNKSSNLKGNYTQSFPTTDNTPGVNTDFVSSDATYGGLCLSCHTSQQTKSYTQPDGTTVTQVLNINNFNGSAHNYGASSSFSDNTTFNANCAKCHNDTMTKEKQTSTLKFSTHDSTFRSILTPFGDSTLTDPINEKFCYKCHGTDNPNYSTGKDFYNVSTMSTNALSIQSKFSTTTDLSTPSSHNLTKMSCTSCHNEHNVSKRDATTGNSQTATTSVFSDPSNTLNPFTTASGDIVAFCLKCHTAGTKPTATNTATTYVPMTQTFTDPGTNGFTNNGSGWYKDIFTSGAHYNNPLKKVVCTDCHDPHGSSNPLLRKSPDDSATTDGDCFKCHNGTVTGVPNIKAEFSKSYKHPSLSSTAGLHTVTENYNNLGSTSRHAKCEDCHDPHSLNDGKTTLTAAISTTGAISFTVADGNQIPNTNGAKIKVGVGTANEEIATVSSISTNTINVSPGLTKTHSSGETVSVAAPTRAGMLRNASGVGVGTRTAWTSLPYNSTTYTFKKAVDNEYELCYKCHTTYAWGTTPPTAPSGGLETDIAQQFNTANVSYHPVEGPTKNTWSYITAENFNTNTPFRKANAGKQTMYCFDCHGDDQLQADGYTGQVRGPHGSANKYLLKKPYDKGTANAVKNDLCTMCHSASVYDSSTTANGNATGFRNSSGTNLHLEHRNAYYPSYAGGSGTFFCGDCHGLYVHGQQRPHLIVYQTDPAPYNSWSALINYTNPGSGNYTETSCRVGTNPRTGTKCYGGH